MYGIVEGEPFQVFARRGSDSSDRLVLRFECQVGMGVLGIRKAGRTDPAPSTNYEEAEIEPGSLRAGRFVHVLSSGQRQSYALSRIGAEVARQLPSQAWVELQPHTEYGFRYLVATETDLASVAAPTEPVPPDPPGTQTPSPAVEVAESPALDSGDPSLPPRPTPTSSELVDTALASLDATTAVSHLRAEMSKVQVLHDRLVTLQRDLDLSRDRERDLLEILARWQQRG